ncbi:MAG: non-heme chloroperoxidase, partial [Solirubrobacteraceae bacterium]|nr:non-heme chloroperoxidase [Solirubrobacteraceae bacterium]
MLDTRTPDLVDVSHPIRSLALGDGRVTRYLDTGEPGRHPVVFFGGVGTSAGAFSLTEFARDERDRLALRFISVERNGFGATPFTPGLGFADAVDDVLAVLAELDVDRFSVVAISGGGPYAARLTARVPRCVASLHLAAATSGGALAAGGAAADLLADVPAIAQDPAAFWEYPADSTVRHVPGFMDAARDEGRRALGDPARAAAALRHELALLGSDELPDLREVASPAFLYWGEADQLVPLEHLRAWQAAL